MKQPDISDWQGRPWILLCACALTLPLVLRGSSCGHDFDFHVQSWLAVANQWQHGTFYPDWVEGANYGAGEPRFIFYPPLTWMLGALLGLTFPWAAVPVSFTFVVMLGCGLSMQRLARAYLPGGSATIAACAYMMNPYALFVAYERTAYGELAAGVWLPLLILYGLQKQPWLSNQDGASGRFGVVPLSQSVVPLALLVAVTWLTNAPAAVMACYLLGGITIWQVYSHRAWRPLLTNTAGLLLGLGLSSFYLVPAACERRWVDIRRAVGPGMRIQDSFLFGHTGEAFHDQVLRTASWIFVALLAAIFTTLLVVWRSAGPRRITRVLGLTTSVLFALQLPWSRFLWKYTPELPFLQFPWRLSLVLSIVFAISVGLAWATLGRIKRGWILSAGLILGAAAASGTIAGRVFWQPCDEEDAFGAQRAVFQAGSGFQGTDEYTTLGADNSIVPQGSPQVRVLDDPDAEIAASPAGEDSENTDYVAVPADEVPAEVEIARWQAEDKLMRIKTSSASYAVLRLMDFPAWQVLVNGSVLASRPHRDDGLLAVPLRAGSNNIEVHYRSTPDVLAGRALSGLSLTALLALVSLRKQAVSYHDRNAA